MNATVEVGAADILGEAVMLALASVAAVALYRAMRRPRLRLVPGPDGRSHATRRDVIQYALSTPLLVATWILLLSAVLIASPADMTGARILIVSSAVVLATRALAHLVTEPAHELAKAVPLTLVVLVLIRGQTRSVTSLQVLIDDLGRTSESLAALALVFLADYAFTAAWYWIGVRRLAPRGHAVPGVPPACPAATRPSASSGPRTTVPGRYRAAPPRRPRTHRG